MQLELNKAKEIIIAWNRSIPGDSTELAAQTEIHRSACVLEAQMLINESDHSDALHRFFSENGMHVSRRIVTKKPSQKWSPVSKVTLSIAGFIIVLALVLIAFSDPLGIERRHIVGGGLVGLFFTLLLFLSGDEFIGGSSHHHYH